MEQNREPQNKPMHMCSTNFQQRHQEHKIGKDSLFSKWSWENWISTCRRMKLCPYLTSYTKINSKWIEDLRKRPETIKFSDENIGEKLLDIGLGSNFLDTTSKAQTTEAKINETTSN